MINDENLNSYIGGGNIHDYINPVNGWSNNMQIPTNKPIDDEKQRITFSRGQINFKQVSVPSGFVYHKISIPLHPNGYSDQITHISVKLNDNDSFVYADIPDYLDEDLNLPIYGRKISEDGIAYIMYPHIVLRIEHYHIYIITNDGIKFEIDYSDYNIHSYNAVLVEIFIELDIRAFIDDSQRPLFRTYGKPNVVQNAYGWFTDIINKTIRLNTSLTDTLNKEYIKFIGANITKYNCYEENNNTTTYSKQENGEAYFNSEEKDTFLNELNNNIYNDFHNNSDADYKMRGMFNYRDIENNIKDTYKYPDGETIEDYRDDEDNITFLESVALSLMRYRELNNTNNYIKNYNVNDFSNDLKSLMTKLKNLDKAEDDILWGKGVPQLKDSIVSAYTFKKNKILLKVRK